MVRGFRRHPAYRESTVTEIMVGGFVAPRAGTAIAGPSVGLHPPALLRYTPTMETLNLSTAALSLFRRRLAKEWVDVTDETRPVYRELVESGLMIPLSTWAGGPESRFLFTELGWALRQEALTETVPHP